MLTLRVDDDTLKRIDRLAIDFFEEGRSEIVRLALNAGLKQLERKAKE